MYKNEIDAGKMIFEKYQEHKKSNNRITILDCVGLLQAGKTGGYSIGLRSISDNHPQTLPPIIMTALTTYSLTDLNNQLVADLQELDDIVDVVKITKISGNIKKENTQELKSLRGGIIVLDEGEFGLVSAEHNKTGQPGRVERLIEYLIATGESYFIMIVGATNYSLNIADQYGDLTVPKLQVVFEPGDGYRGINELVQSNKFHDMPTVRNAAGLIAKPPLLLLDKELLSNPFGIYQMRADDRKHTTADAWKNQLNIRYKNPKYNVEVFTIYSGQSGYDISTKLKEVLKLGRSKNVIIIVCGAMAAGYRINQRLKMLIRFSMDISVTQSTLVQGLIGRTCGYNLDYMPTIISRRDACQTYLNYQDSVRGLCDFNPVTGKASTWLTSKNEFVSHIDSKDEGDFDSLDMAKDYVVNNGDTLKDISLARENVKDRATISKFKRRMRELKSLRGGKGGNYLHIGWGDDVNNLKKYTALLYKTGKVSLVSKCSKLMTINQTSAKNRSLFGENSI